MTDPIADLLTRIRNAINARHDSLEVPSSKIKLAIVKIMKDEGYIGSFIHEEQKPQGVIRIFLKYNEKKDSAIRKLVRISRPGGRVYRGYRKVQPYLRGMGLTILSTPMGVVTDKQARQSKIGGEVLCQIW